MACGLGKTETLQPLTRKKVGARERQPFPNNQLSHFLFPQSDFPAISVI
jgi:hypothetical protein